VADRPSTPQVRIQLNTIGDPARAERCLDQMEQATGVRGERNPMGRLYVVEGEEVGEAADRIVRNLPAGWQDHFMFKP
jgi:hypothetical protein